MNIFIHHRDLRYIDNTSLIEQIQNEGNITPIFIFDPKQIDKTVNKYFSDNLVQFMVESLENLQTDYKKKQGYLYTFRGKYIKILESINKKTPINSIGFNYDYSPYALSRDNTIITWAKRHNIKTYIYEDMLLHPILTDKILTKSDEPYQVFTPFKNELLKRSIKPINKFKKFVFKKFNILKENKYYFNYINHKLYDYNKNLLVKGGRDWALNRLKNIKQFNKYNTNRDIMTYETTLLSSSINFNVVSIREIYYKIIKTLGNKSNLINELIWRDFYYNILFYNPHIIKGSFRKKYDKIKWANTPLAKKHFSKWCSGMTGFPLVDACMRQLNTTGYMHNRGRMIVSSFLIKNLWIDWRKGEKYFAQHLTDYNISANNGGWQWSSGGGTDAQPYFRIFNVWTQSKKYDPQCLYIKKWIPELINVPNKDIHKWYETSNIYIKQNIKYVSPIVDHDTTRINAINLYKKYLK
jgi:deoxyribodipyrimidine photo-lyase